jgi:hypothetical protein
MVCTSLLKTEPAQCLEEVPWVNQHRHWYHGKKNHCCAGKVRVMSFLNIPSWYWYWIFSKENDTNLVLVVDCFLSKKT